MTISCSPRCAKKEGPGLIRDYVGSTLASSRALGVKVINAGAAMAFKHNCAASGSTTSCPPTG